MTPAKAVTNRHPVFLKAAYKHGLMVDLFNDERWFSPGDKYIRFDPSTQSFVVCIKTTDRPLTVRIFDNMMSAINCARRSR